jgi:tetratricopeptide (TPR) repeat protein
MQNRKNMSSFSRKFSICIVFSLLIFGLNMSLCAQNELKKLTDSAGNLYLKGDYAASLALFEYLMSLNEVKSNLDILAPQSEAIGYIYYINGKYDKAETFFRMSVNYFVRQRSAYEDMARTMMELGMVLREKGDNAGALSYFTDAETVLTKTQPRGPMMANIKILIGLIYYNYGDFDKALHYLLLGNEIAKVQPDGAPYFQALALPYCGLAYLEKKQYAKAVDYFRKYLEMKDISQTDRSLHLGHLAFCYNKLGKNDLAQRSFTEAIKNASGLNEFEIYMNYGRFLTQTKRFSEAAIYLNKAFKGYSMRLGFHNLNTINALYYKGDLWLSQRKPDSALACFQYALQLLCNGFSSYAYADNPPAKSTVMISHLLALLDKKSAALRMMSELNPASKLYWLKLSLKTYRLATNVIESLYSGYQSDESRVSLSELQSQVFADAIAVCNAIYELTHDRIWIDAAFKFAEKSKAGALMTVFQGREAQRVAGIPAYIRDADQQLNNAMYQLEKRIQDAGSGVDSSIILPLRDKQVQLNLVREQLNTYLEKQFSSYSRLKGNGRNLSISGISGFIPADAAFIEYVCSDTVIYIFFIDNKGFEMIPVSIDTSFYSLLGTYRQMLSAASPVFFSKYDYANYLDISYRIWSVLLKPCSGKMSCKTRVMIAQDARLGVITFDGLIDQLPDTNASRHFVDFRTPEYLIKKYAFSYCYSASWLMTMYRGDASGNNDLVLFAPEYGHFSKDKGGHINLPQLKGAYSEAVRIADDWGGDLYKGDEATVSNFINKAPEANILHLAMHSVVNEKDQLLSGLIFSGTEIKDSKLDAAMIYSMRLKASLVVLSSCSSGYGRTARGEGIMSLARAFVYAGSKSVVMALWPVDDAAGANIMEGFYKELDKGLPMDIALREAKLKFIKQSGSITSNPSYWASYIITGQCNPVEKISHSQAPAVYISSLVFVMLIGITIFARRYQRKRAKRKSNLYIYPVN